MQGQLRNLLKLVGALAIPIGIYALWNWSIHQSDVELNEYQKNQKEHPLSGKTTVDNYQLKEIDGMNHLRWRLIAKRGVMETEAAGKDVLLDQVIMEYFDGNERKMKMTAPKGTVNEDTHIVHLISDDKDHVICDGAKGRLEARQVELTKKNQFVATGGVNIFMPGVAKVTGNQADGVLEKDASLKNFKIYGNTHALIGSI